MDKLWDVFETTGRVEDYLNYRREKDFFQRGREIEGGGGGACSPGGGGLGGRDRGW